MDFGASNKHSLSFTTRNVRVLITLLEAVRQMDRTNLRIGYDETGLYFNEFTNEQSIMLIATLDAQVFDEFKTTGKGVVAIKPAGLITVLKYSAMEDKIRFTYNHRKPETCKVEILKEKKHGASADTYLFELMTYCLEESERTLYVSQQETYDAEAKISARDVQNFITAIINIESREVLKPLSDSKRDQCRYTGDAFVELSVNDSMIVMEEQGDCASAMRSARVVMLTDKGKKAWEDRRLDPYKRTVFDGIKKKFLLRHLQLVNKFFMVNPNKDASLAVYMKKDPPTFPVIFGINVGDMGQAHVALGPYEEHQI